MSKQAAQATPRIADRLSAVRRQGFVGREAELELFRAALVADEPPFVVLHVYGPGGVGKTTLLHEYARIAAEHNRFVIHLDGRHLEPGPPAFATAVQQATGLPTSSNAVANWRPNSVLLIDTYEALAPLDSWLRATFLPQLPADALIVVAGRQIPHAWHSDSGWAELTRSISLGNLRPEDCQAYLAARGVPAEQHAPALDFTHGHPLALALIAQVYQQSAAPTPPQPSGERDIIQILLQRFLQDVPSSSQRQALELCVVAWATTEALLAELFGTAAFELFQWLRQLSFVEQGPYGLYPHDLVRDVLEADLHWRNPAGYARLQQVALTHLQQQFQRASPRERQRIRLDILFINRRAPGIAPYFAWDALDSAYAQPADPSDLPAILEMVQTHEGELSAQIAHYWWQRQPEAFLVYRTTAGDLYGFMTQLALQRATPEDAAIDPAVSLAWQYAQAHQPVQPDQGMLYLRFWMARESYQAISPAINLTAVNCVIHWMTTPNLVWSFVAMSNPNFMAPHFESIRFGRMPEADFVVGERAYGVFGHDWITDPVATWHKAVKGLDVAAPEVEMVAVKPGVALSESEFADAVRQALRDYTRPDLLAANPLVRSGLLPATKQTATELQAVLRQAILDLQQHPKDAKLYRALWHTYIEPEPTQEKTAERLDLPFNTYRYHLTSGVERLIAGLWRRYQPRS